MLMIVALINMDSSLVEGENKVLEDTKENLLSSEDALHENKVHEESSDKSKEITEKEENFKDHNSTEFINPEIKHEEQESEEERLDEEGNVVTLKKKKKTHFQRKTKKFA